MNEIELKKIGEEVGKYLGEGIAGGLLDSSRSATKAFNGFYERLKYQRDFDLISEAEYYTRLEYLRDRYFTKGTDNWIKYTQDIYSYQKKILEAEQKELERFMEAEQKELEKLINAEQKEIEGLYDNISNYATKKLEEVLKKQQKLAENLNSFGSLYNVNTVYMDGYKDTYYSLHDMTNDIEALKRYQRDMASLRERANSLSIPKDASDYLFSNIMEMDTEDALMFMRALLYANDNKFSRYTNSVYEKFTLSQSISAKQYEDEFNGTVSDVYADMKDALLEAGYEIPDGFYVSGSISAQKFGEAFIAELDNQLGIIRGVIDEFNAGLETAPTTGGDVYNTTNTSYNISASESMDAVEQIRRHEAVKRLAGIS